MGIITEVNNNNLTYDYTSMINTFLTSLDNQVIKIFKRKQKAIYINKIRKKIKTTYRYRR